jgi:5-methylcytosine-specific restriction endonuclease McrA
MVGLIKTRLSAAHMLLRGRVLHMRCCAHILNLIVWHGTQLIEKSITTIRESVAYWIATPKRYEMFEKTTLDENVILDRMLNLDCKTRWNSTFIMLSIAIHYRKVFERLGDLDRNYICPIEHD